MRRLQHWLIGLAIFLAGLSMCWAQVSTSQAQALLKKSGVWSQLGSLPAQVRAGMAPSETPLPPEIRQLLRRIADSAFSAQWLRSMVTDHVARQLSHNEWRDAMDWYKTPTGSLITGLEKSMSSAMPSPALMAEGNQAWANASSIRQTLISKIITQTHAAELAVDMQDQLALETFRSMSALRRGNQPVDERPLRQWLEVRQPQRVAASRGELSAWMALVYATLSDEELSAYLQFLESKAGGVFMRSMFVAVGDALAAAIQRFGQELATQLDAGRPKPNARTQP